MIKSSKGGKSVFGTHRWFWILNPIISVISSHQIKCIHQKREEKKNTCLDIKKQEKVFFSLDDLNKYTASQNQISVPGFQVYISYQSVSF